MSGASKHWKLEKEEQGIKVFLAPYAGSDYKEYRVEFTVDTTLSALVAIHTDVPATSKWMDGVESSRRVSGDERDYVTHTLTKVPWPAKDRDAVARTVASQDPETLVTRLDFHHVEHVVPVDKKYERVKSIKGFWEFVPQPGGKVAVVYQNHVEPGGKIPGWLANMFVVDVPLASCKTLVKMLKQGAYRDACFDFVKNA